MTTTQPIDANRLSQKIVVSAKQTHFPATPLLVSPVLQVASGRL
jgi:hypothetical protein